MMENAIANRYAVRSYSPTQLDNDQVKDLIAAFQASPCGMGQADVMQGIVVEDATLRQEIESAINGAAYNAPLLFIIATKKDSNFGERDASVAAENIMIEATAHGLGSVYVMGGAISLNQHPDLLQELGVKDGFQVTTIVPVGKAASQPTKHDRSQRYQLTRK